MLSSGPERRAWLRTQPRETTERRGVLPSPVTWAAPTFRVRYLEWWRIPGERGDGPWVWWECALDWCIHARAGLGPGRFSAGHGALDRSALPPRLRLPGWTLPISAALPGSCGAGPSGIAPWVRCRG